LKRANFKNTASIVNVRDSTDAREEWKQNLSVDGIVNFGSFNAYERLWKDI
jgi:hypothetical protein